MNGVRSNIKHVNHNRTVINTLENHMKDSCMSWSQWLQFIAVMTPLRQQMVMLILRWDALD